MITLAHGLSVSLCCLVLETLISLLVAFNVGDIACFSGGKELDYLS